MPEHNIIWTVLLQLLLHTGRNGTENEQTRTTFGCALALARTFSAFVACTHLSCVLRPCDSVCGSAACDRLAPSRRQHHVRRLLVRKEQERAAAAYCICVLCARPRLAMCRVRTQPCHPRHPATNCRFKTLWLFYYFTFYTSNNII